MDIKANVFKSSGEAGRRETICRASDATQWETAIGGAPTASRVLQFPAGLRESVAERKGEYDARRLRSQREVIRDVMLAAADCDTWLTLGELRALTRYGEASISAQLRHLRKMENGGYDVTKRHREGATPGHCAVDGRGECIWEYRVTRMIDDRQLATSKLP